MKKKLAISAAVAVLAALAAYLGVPEEYQQQLTESLTVLLTIIGGLL
jgi:hypothetical protein